MDLSIVIPAYNESGRMRATLSTLVHYFSGTDLSWEIVVVDDGSEDGTVRTVEEYAKERDSATAANIRVKTIPHQGKGAAVAEGVKTAQGDWILMTDADLSTPVTEWERIEKELSNGAQVVAGSRQISGSQVEVHQPWLRQSLGIMFGFLVRLIFRLPVIDSQCGFKGFQREAALTLFNELSSSGFCFDVEVLLRARQYGFTIKEVPVRWYNHPDSRVRLSRDWPGVMKELFKLRFGHDRKGGPREGPG
ncbi:MAG: glycosyltransferase family 2 protein [bacterium]